MDFGVFTSGGDGSPKGVLHFNFLSCMQSLLENWTDIMPTPQSRREIMPTYRCK